MQIKVDVVQRRKQCYLSQYRQKREVRNTKKSESDAADMKVPKWFVYWSFTLFFGTNKPKKKKEYNLIYSHKFWILATQ